MMRRVVSLLVLLVPFILGSCYREQEFSIVFTSDVRARLTPAG